MAVGMTGRMAKSGIRGGITGVAATLAVALAGGMVALVPIATPVAAHQGGKAVVLVRDLTIAPAGADWMAKAVLSDFDAGSPIQGADVKATTSAPAKTYTLEPAGALGTYTARLDGVKPGPTDITLRVRTIPGNEGFVPFNQTWPIELVAGQPTLVASASGGGGGSNVGPIVGVSGAVLAIAMLYGLYALRRRSAAPTQAT